MKKYIVVIDPGHGGVDPGAIGPTGLKEKDINLSIALKLKSILESYNIKVIMTRTDDSYVSLDKRVRIANDSKANYFISIHINSAANPNATGTETYAYAKGVEGDRLAHSIQKNLVNQLGLADRGVKYNSLQVVRQTTMPAALTEVAFINNPTEEKLLNQDEFLERASIGIVKGILEHLNIDYTPVPKETVELSEEEKTKKWQAEQGLEHLNNLVEKGIIDTSDYWEGRLLENMPIWAILSLIDRITDK